VSVLRRALLGFGGLVKKGWRKRKKFAQAIFPLYSIEVKVQNPQEALVWW
jgi:hypothetical protein